MPSLSLSKNQIVLLIGTILLLFILSTTSGGAGDQIKCKTSDVCTARGSRPCARMDPMKLVVELDDGNIPRYYGFCVKVDQFSILNLEGSGKYMNTTSNSTISVRIGDYETSDGRYYMNEEMDAIVSQYTVIIGLNNGRFRRSNSTKTNIVFENSCEKGVCVLDRSAPCIRGSDCGISMSDVYDVKANASSIADIKLYLAWEGSATANAALRSASLLPSRFRAYSFTNYYQQLYNMVAPKFRNTGF